MLTFDDLRQSPHPLCEFGVARKFGRDVGLGGVVALHLPQIKYLVDTPQACGPRPDEFPPAEANPPFAWDMISTKRAGLALSYLLRLSQDIGHARAPFVDNLPETPIGRRPSQVPGRHLLQGLSALSSLCEVILASISVQRECARC